MNSSNFRFTLDIQSIQSQVSIPVMLGDTSRRLSISFTDGGLPYTIVDGCLAKLSVKRPDGSHFEEFCAIENNTVVRYDFSQNEKTAVIEGLHACDLTLYDEEGGRITSPRFTMVVSGRVINSDDINITDDDMTAIDNMILAETARQSAEEARVIAESGRVEAESERQTALKEAIAKVSRLVGARIVSINLPASAWKGNASPYSQVVTIDGITEYSKVDLLPSVEQLAIFHEKDLAFVTENDGGVVTVYSVGDKPTNDYTMQASITEVVE